MSLPELHVALDRTVRAWVAAACVWKDGWSLGEYRFVVFSIDVAPKTRVYVQLWSEPRERVAWEVSSGRWNPPADTWLAGDRSNRIAAFGFEPDGRADNFYQEVAIQSRSDVMTVSRTIVDILYTAYDYRGTLELNAHLAYQSRAELRPVLTSVTPEDVTKILTASGYSLVNDNQDEDAQVLQFRTRGVVTSVEFHDQVPDEHLFETAVLSCTLPVVSGNALRQASSCQSEGDREVVDVGVGTGLSFAGGVTVEWLSGRVAAWTNMIVDRQHQARRIRRKARNDANALVH